MPAAISRQNLSSSRGNVAGTGSWGLENEEGAGESYFTYVEVKCSHNVHSQWTDFEKQVPKVSVSHVLQHYHNLQKQK